MKLSAKLFTALAAMALLVVAIVGAPGVAQAANTDGSVDLTNKWSKLTTKTGGFTATQTGGTAETAVTTLYSTFIEKKTDGTALQSIETNSNVVIVSVMDVDKNAAVAKTATSSWTQTTDEGKTYNLGSIAGASAVPIIDTDGDGDFNDEVSITSVGTTSGNGLVAADWTVAVQNAATGLVNVFSAASSNTTNTGNGITFAWKSSATDTVAVTVKSTSDTTGIALTATETGRDTSVFRVEVSLIDAEVTGAASSSTTKTLIVLHNGTVTAEYSDDTPKTGSTAVKKTGTLSVETNAPTASIAGPANLLATQDQTPSFSGSIVDTGGSGLDATVVLYVDDENDATNTAGVEIAAGDANTPVNNAGAKDGDSTITWTFTPSNGLPTGVSTPDHLVDFQIRAADMAGNVNWSDADANPDDNYSTSTDAPDAPGEGEVTTPGRGQPTVIRIDRTIPSVSKAYTGHKWDTSVATAVRKADDATRIEVLFDGPIDASTVATTDFEVTISSTKYVPTAAEVFAKVPASVFLTVDATIPSDNKPTVAIKSPIADTAGNTTSSGSVAAFDSLAPVVTLALTGGSSATAPTTLTKDKITATVTSDEALGSVRVKIYKPGSVLEATITPVAQGGNIWKSVISSSGSGLTEGKLSVTAVATDPATADAMDFNNDGDTSDAVDSVAPNVRTKGNADTTSTSAVNYTYDKTAPAVTVSPSGTANDERSPFVTLTYGEKVTINKATFNAVDVSASLATTDSKKYIYVTSDLALQAHKVISQATDLAGNKSAEETNSFTIIKRDNFDLTLSAGWNAKSIPGPAVDPSIDVVFSNADVDQVLAYDATDAASPWRIATKSAGTFASTTETPLTAIEQGRGYWVHSDTFKTQEVALVGPVGPSSASPPPVITIATAEGWNFVGIVDPTRAKTTGAASTFSTATAYFASVNNQRIFAYDATVPNFVEKSGSNALTTGDGIWVYISKQSDGSLPDIVPPAQ